MKLRVRQTLPSIGGGGVPVQVKTELHKFPELFVVRDVQVCSNGSLVLEIDAGFARNARQNTELRRVSEAMEVCDLVKDHRQCNAIFEEGVTILHHGH